MAAGQGFKTFANGDILTAADVNGYLMQNVWVFASTAARDAAVTAPQQGNMAYTKDTDTIWKYTGSTWTNIDTTGSSPLTTKGDLYGYSTTNARVPIGTNGQVLTADSTQALGLKWATATSAKSFSLLSTTSMAGATSYTISSLSGYDRLIVIFKNIRCTDTANNATYLKVNSTTTTYEQFGYSMSPASTMSSVYVGSSTSGWKLMNNGTTSNNQDLNGYVIIDGANTSGEKMLIQATATASTTSGLGLICTGHVTDSAVVSSLTISTTGGNLSSGTVYVYGAA